jgi:hypothetical protein
MHTVFRAQKSDLQLYLFSQVVRILLRTGTAVRQINRSLAFIYRQQTRNEIATGSSQFLQVRYFDPHLKPMIRRSVKALSHGSVAEKLDRFRLTAAPETLDGPRASKACQHLVSLNFFCLRWQIEINSYNFQRQEKCASQLQEKN